MFSTISEDFLHYVWRSLNFDSRSLQTIEGQAVEIIRLGQWNHDQGPDFLHACIRLGEVEWHGQVELHLHSRDWYRHNHQKDPNYNNTILHVVLESAKQEIFREDGTKIPELSLEGRIPTGLYSQYERMRLSQDQIPCSFAIKEVESIHIYSWIERLTVERMEEKATRMREELHTNVQDWEQILWEELAAMMGGPVNQAAMRQMAHQLPFKILKKYIRYPEKIEALILGAGGLLIAGKPLDDYYQQLRESWQFLKHKHELEASPVNLRFMRMRPAAFPTIRLSQIGVLISRISPLIQLLETNAYEVLENTDIKASDYWNNHYRFGEATEKQSIKRLGKSQKQILMINTLVPLSLLYHRAHGREETYTLIEESLTKLAPERNKITKCFEALDIKNEQAFHSQGLIQLKKKYCDEKRCLSCGIGHQVLKQD